MASIKQKFINIAKAILPKSMMEKARHRRYKKEHYKKLEKLKADILNFHSLTEDPEIKEVIAFLEKNDLTVFPYNFRNNYSPENIEVKMDLDFNLPYVNHEGKRLFFKRGMSVKAIQNLYYGLQLDQDTDSPHLYLTEDFTLASDDVIADVGAAEGNFSLSNIEKVKKAYLFESDPEWIEALKATFRPWAEKVEIVNAFITDHDSETTISMRTFYKDHPEISFFKVDIEGEEQNFLNACKPVFEKNHDLKIAICTYHKENDAHDFSKQLKEMGFEVNHSKGYMIYHYDPAIRPPFLRRGLLRASKNRLSA